MKKQDSSRGGVMVDVAVPLLYVDPVAGDVSELSGMDLADANAVAVEDREGIWALPIEDNSKFRPFKVPDGRFTDARRRLAADFMASDIMRGDVVFEAGPARYRVEFHQRDEWKTDVHKSSLKDAMKVAEDLVRAYGFRVRVLDTQLDLPIGGFIVKQRPGVLDEDLQERLTHVGELNALAKVRRAAEGASQDFMVTDEHGGEDLEQEKSPVDRRIGTVSMDVVLRPRMRKENTEKFTDPSEPVNKVATSEPASRVCELDGYQREAKVTAVFTHDRALEYLALGLASEAGEVAGKVKKFIRDGQPLDEDGIAAELGDVLWYVAVLADHIAYSLSEVAEANIQKLKDRQERGKLGGSGDIR